MSAAVELQRYPGDRSIGIGERDHHHDHSANEAFYENVRKPAEAEYRLRDDCMRRATEAYERGDGARAKQLSNEGKKHAAKADERNAEASIKIYKRNNANRNGNEVDLHGQFVHEAVSLLPGRLVDARNDGYPSLHVIVGKGNHSVGHKQKIKPAIEELCHQLELKCETEAENEGRIEVYLTKKNVRAWQLPSLRETHPAIFQDDNKPSHEPYEGHQQHHPDQQQQHHSGQQHHGGQNQEEQYDDIEKFITKFIKKLVNKYCCVVM